MSFEIAAVDMQALAELQRRIDVLVRRHEEMDRTITTMLAEREQLRDMRDVMARALERITMQAGGLRAEREVLLAKNKGAVAALVRLAHYAQHLGTCTRSLTAGTVHGGPPPCDCGFDAFVAEMKALGEEVPS